MSAPQQWKEFCPSYIDQYTLYCSVLTTEHAYYWNRASMLLLKADVVSRLYRDLMVAIRGLQVIQGLGIKEGKCWRVWLQVWKAYRLPLITYIQRTLLVGHKVWSQNMNYEFSAFGKERWSRVGKEKKGGDLEEMMNQSFTSMHMKFCGKGWETQGTLVKIFRGKDGN